MSDLTALLAIAALGLSGAFFSFYFSRMTNELADQIVTGFIGDHRIPPTQRSLMLYSKWVSYVTGGVSAVFFVGFAALLIADHLDHADSKLLAYLTAFLLSVGAVIWLVQGTVHFISYRTLLRQAEAD
jgi:peptidoglycan/LPS O-acetylase OafA/YrhL